MFLLIIPKVIVQVCSAKFRALAQVFEKSATELKPKPKLFKFKNIVNIATLNVWT